MGPSRSSVDISIIDTVLAAIKQGDYPALEAVSDKFAELRAELASCKESAAAHRLRRDLKALICSSPGVFEEVVLAIVKNTLAFLHEEMEKYAAIKAIRPLTEEEKRIGREVLIPLAKNLASFVAELAGQETD